MKELIDTHCHIYESDFDKDRDEIIELCKKEGVKKIYMPNINLKTIDPMLDVYRKYPNYCLPMMGLHPCDVDKDYKEVLKKMEKYIKKTPSILQILNLIDKNSAAIDKKLLHNKEGNTSSPFCAIGEIGLDLYRDKTFLKEQIQAFKIQLQWAMELHLPVVIHCRNAFNQMIDIVKEFTNISTINKINRPHADNTMLANFANNLKDNKYVRGIVHCFSGTLEEAQKIIDLGFLLGIGGVITFKNSNLREVIKSIDLKHIVLETDSPYLAPVPYRGKRNNPSLLTYIAKEIAIAKNISIYEVDKHTTYNAEKLFTVFSST